MITKKYSDDGRTCVVTFALPSQINAKTAHLYGDFTEWEKSPKLMTHHKDGSFSAKITLQAGHSYRFRYLLDGGYWENDWEADAYTPNPFGTEDSIIKV